MPFSEGLHDRHDRQRLCLVALVAADLEGEAAAVDQQPDDDLGVDAAFLGVADLAQIVFLLGFEVERGHVIEDQADVAVGGGVVEAGGGDLAAVVALLCPLQRSEHRAQRCRLHADLAQHANRVSLRGRLDEPCQHELRERLIADGVEAQPRIGAGQDLPQQRRALARDQSRALGHTGILESVHVEVEHFLALVKATTRLCHQHRQLRVRTRCAYMLHDHITPAAALSDLDLRAAPAARRLPHEHHRATIPTPGVCQSRAAQRPDQRRYRARSAIPAQVARVRSQAARYGRISDGLRPCRRGVFTRTQSSPCCGRLWAISRGHQQ